MRPSLRSLAIAAVTLAFAAPAAAEAAPGASARAAAGGVTAPETAGAGATGGASYGTLQQIDAEEATERRAAERRRAAQRKRAAQRRATVRRQRAAARRAAARKRAARARRLAAKRRAAARRRGGAPKAPVTPAPPATSDHVFPVAGSFSLGGAGSRFGAQRPGHIHQGQDVSAALGTPVVAPWAGTVRFVKFQASGAGYYVVLAGQGQNRDYVFMHLRRGSILVKPGDVVAKGQPLAQVGNSGSSSGPHLHFEIWQGGWYVKGGKPVDPLPFLQAWLS